MWIKWHDDLINHAVFQSAVLLKLFTYCCLKATHREFDYIPKGIRPLKLKPGEFVTSLSQLSSDIGSTPKTARRWLTSLEEMGCLRIKTTNKYTRITVVNWAHYQHVPSEITEQMTNKCASNDKQVTNKCPAGDKRNRYIDNTENKENKNRGSDEPESVMPPGFSTMG